MDREIEVKFRLDEPDGLRRRLGELGAARAENVRELNHILDTSDGRLRAEGRVLRVRRSAPLTDTAPPNVTLTCKGPREDTPAGRGIKMREEVEVGVADEATLLLILARLGLQTRVTYEKRRETWHCAGCQVMLDELPELGWFAEIEGPDAAAIQACQAALGLDASDIVTRSYVSLASQHGTCDATGVRRLAFRR